MSRWKSKKITNQRLMISKKIIGKNKHQMLKIKKIKLKPMKTSKIKLLKWSMLLPPLAQKLRMNSKIREVEGMVEDLEVGEEGVEAIILIGEEDLDIHSHTRDSRIREAKNSISKINIEEEVEVEDVVVEAIIHSLGIKKTTRIAPMISMSFRRRVKNITTIKEGDVVTLEDEEPEVKEVSSEVAVEVVEGFNHKKIMSNQKQRYNMILNQSQVSLFTKKSEREVKSKLISEISSIHNSINNRNPMG